MKIRNVLLSTLFYICSATQVAAAVITGINVATESIFTDGIEIGGTGIGWSRANEQFGYLQNGEFSSDPGTFFRPETQYANVVDSSVWFQFYDTYDGFDNHGDIKNAAQYAYSSQSIMFAAKNTPWYRGILLAKQGGNYLAIDPLEIFINDLGLYTLKYQYWYGTNGETDLSVVSAPEPSILLLFVIGFMLLSVSRVKMAKVRS